MKKNLMAALTASSVALMAGGATLAAYVGADVTSTDIVNRTSDGVKDAIMLEFHYQDDLYNWREKVSAEDLEKVTAIYFNDYGNSITNIPEGCFKGLTNLEKVILPYSSSYSSYGIQEIGESAFEGCTSLKEIGFYTSTTYLWDPKTQYVGGGYVTAMPRSIKRIGDNAFKGCESLEEINFSYDYDSGKNLESIGNNAFEGCTSLTNLDLGAYYSGTIQLGKEAFKDCTGLEYLRIQSGYFYDSRASVNIGESAFEGCKNLRYADLKGIHGSSVIGKRAFADCFKLWKIALPGTESSTKNDSVLNGTLTIESEAFFNTICEGILLPKADNPEDIQIAPDFFDYCDKFKANLKTPLNKYVIYNSDSRSSWGSSSESYWDNEKQKSVYRPGTYSAPSCLKDLPDNITVLSWSAKNEYGETQTYLNYDYVSNDYTAQDPATITIESALPAEGTVRLPDFVEEYPHQVTKVLDNSGNEVAADKITWTHNPMFEFGGSTTTPHLLDGQNVEEPAGGYDFVVDPAPDPNAPTCPVCPPCSDVTSNTSETDSSTPVTSEDNSSNVESQPTTSNPVTSNPSTPATSNPSTSTPTTSNPSTSTPVTSNPSTSTPGTGEQSGSGTNQNNPNNKDPEENGNMQKPADGQHDNEIGVSGIDVGTPNNGDNVNSVVDSNPGGANPNTGVRFLAPAIFAGAAIVVVAVRRRKMK